jgi:disulfide bond formation protein DsbB
MAENSKNLLIKLIFLISIVALASAFFIEYKLGHQPCNLCILERIPYLLAIILIILNYKFNHLEKYFLILLAICIFIATILSLYHLGIEQGFIQESMVCDLKKWVKFVIKRRHFKAITRKKRFLQRCNI